MRVSGSDRGLYPFGINRVRMYQARFNRVGIAARLLALRTTPDIGRPFDGEEGLRELVIGFGSSGYVALYRHDPADDAVYVLALRHQREAGYP